MSVQVVSPTEWLQARKSLLEKEKAHSRAQDALATERRAMPMVVVDKPYVFEDLEGKKLSLADLFGGRSQLIVYHFMFGPDDEEGCPSCSLLADNMAPVEHLHSRDTALVLVSRAPTAKIEAFRKRMGWTDRFPWVSSLGSDFNYDFHVTNDPAVRPVEYNYDDGETLEKKGIGFMGRGEQPGASVFYRDGDRILHSYSTYMRGLDNVIGTYQWLDLTPRGRQDAENNYIMGFKHHDKYAKCC